MSHASATPRATGRAAPCNAGPAIQRSSGESRADIQALRALAVLAVLLYHLWPGRLPGGYVGVDVFFVISGFLITAHLLRELETTGSMRVAQFWARRARRLLPAALLVLFATVVGIIWLVPGGLWGGFLAEVGASTLYVENWFLAVQSVDYLGASAVPSPVQHFWTLSVEEQFYFALPLLMLAAVGVMRSSGRAVRGILLVALVAITLASFTYSVLFTAVSSAAFFSTGTRAWEFGLGALIAFVPAISRRRTLLTALGLTAILASVLFFSAATPFPGVAALAPAGGTALAIWAGRATFLTRLGELRPIALIGATSYGIYLWHWPLIVLVPYATGLPLGGAQKVAIAVVAIVLAWLSTRFWEDPVRFSPRFLGGRAPRIVALWSIAGMAIVLAVAGGSLAAQKQVDDAARAAVAREVDAAVASECFGAAAKDPSLQPCALPPLSVLVPPLLGLGEDDDNRAECWSARESAELNVCTLGPEEGYSSRLLVLGDSHSNTLIGAYDRIARERGWRIDLAGHSGCYLTTAALGASDENARTACDRWRAAALDLVASAVDIDGIVVTRSTTMTAAIPNGSETAQDAQIDGLVAAWNSRANPDIPIVVLVDNPAFPAETYACLERAGVDEAETCAMPRADVLGHDLQRDAVARVDNAHLIDLTDLYCGADRCDAVIGGAVVYRPDGHHLTAAFARTLAPYLADGIAAALGPVGAARAAEPAPGS